MITFTVPSGFVEEKTKEKVENREEIYILYYDLTVVIRNDTYLLQINTKIFSDQTNDFRQLKVALVTARFYLSKSFLEYVYVHRVIR